MKKGSGEGTSSSRPQARYIHRSELCRIRNRYKAGDEVALTIYRKTTISFRCVLWKRPLRTDKLSQIWITAGVKPAVIIPIFRRVKD